MRAGVRREVRPDWAEGSGAGGSKGSGGGSPRQREEVAAGVGEGGGKVVTMTPPHQGSAGTGSRRGRWWFSDEVLRWANTEWK